MQSFKQIAKAAARVVNSTLGVPCTYTLYDDTANPLADVQIIIDKNTPVKDGIGNILGYEVVASVEKDALPRKPMQRDTFLDDEGNVWHVGGIREETLAKWYFSVQGR